MVHVWLLGVELSVEVLLVILLLCIDTTHTNKKMQRPLLLPHLLAQEQTSKARKDAALA